LDYQSLQLLTAPAMSPPWSRALPDILIQSKYSLWDHELIIYVEFCTIVLSSKDSPWKPSENKIKQWELAIQLLLQKLTISAILQVYIFLLCNTHKKLSSSHY
jgi:hypothetical protein